MMSVQVIALTWANTKASLSGLPVSKRDKPFNGRRDGLGRKFP
ncbi:hypothetical protein J2853_001499 [Streptosporangium lutulentum]|uniref:Uncharacterized protein n=1 Tax=Streptosporangium lutulentum TaxID=1461250 RepID=A0ABT9Q6D3_9ACTN|nr:hypothetical protein [Streptosporangium lutulentum]